MKTIPGFGVLNACARRRLASDGGRGLRRWLRGGLVGCTVLVACVATFEAPQVRIAGVRVVSLGLDEGTAAVDLEVVNPNRRALELRGVRYRLRVEDPRRPEAGWLTLGEGVQPEDRTIEPRDTTVVGVTVPFGYEAVEVAVRSLLQEGRLDYRLDGEVRLRGPVGDLRVPLEHSGSFGPLRREDGRPTTTKRQRPREVPGSRTRTSPAGLDPARAGDGANATKSNSTIDDSFRHS